MSDLIDRLKLCSKNCGDEYLHELTGRAANEIQRLREENDELKCEWVKALRKLKDLTNREGD